MAKYVQNTPSESGGLQRVGSIPFNHLGCEGELNVFEDLTLLQYSGSVEAYVRSPFADSAKSLFEGVSAMVLLFPVANSESDEVDYDLLAQIVIPIILFVLGLVTAVCFSIDKSDSVSWAKFAFTRDISMFMIRDLTAISVAMLIHIWITDSFESKWQGILCAYYMLVASEFIPSVLAAMLTAASTGAADADKSMDYESLSKARKVVLFGIRYGSLISSVGLTVAFDSAILLGLLQQALKQSSLSDNKLLSLGDTDCFFAEMNLAYVATARAASALALQAVELQHAKILLSAIQGAAILCLINVFVYAVGYVGRQVGIIVASQALPLVTRARNQRGALMPKSTVGVVVLSCWLLSLGFIVRA
jgi:hypothetical protein